MTTDAVVLAAGRSSRAGTNKMLLKLEKKTVIESCIETYYDFCDEIIVVGGYEIDKIKSVLEKYARVRLVFNARYSDGMFSSVREGLSYVRGVRFLLTPGDYPIVKKATIKSMCEIFEPILIPRYNAEPGHPVLMLSRHIPEILHSSYISLREYILSNGPKYLDTDDIGVITDIDTPEDYNRVRCMG